MRSKLILNRGPQFSIVPTKLFFLTSPVRPGEKYAVRLQKYYHNFKMSSFFKTLNIESKRNTTEAYDKVKLNIVGGGDMRKSPTSTLTLTFALAFHLFRAMTGRPCQLKSHQNFKVKL